MMSSHLSSGKFVLARALDSDIKMSLLSYSASTYIKLSQIFEVDLTQMIDDRVVGFGVAS